MNNIRLKAEAINRMKKLHLFNACIKAFEDRNEVQMSEPTGALFEFSNDKWLNSLIDDFQKKHNCLVYHVIHSYTDFGELYNLLYVDNEVENWDGDNIDLNDGYVFVWCENKTEPMFSEFGTIGVGHRFGGLIRNF